MRYFRGFIQLQDLIDNAIIQLKSSEKLPEFDVVTQQMPYPCWTNDLYELELLLFYRVYNLCVSVLALNLHFPYHKRSKYVSSLGLL